MKIDDNAADIENCENCAVGKHSRQPFKSSDKQTTNVLDLIHSDLVGPMETSSIGKAKYLLTFIDDYSRTVFCFFISSKADVIDAFVKFKNFVENQTGRKIKVFRTDNGTEYVNHRFENLPKSYWAEAVNMAVHLISRSINANSGDKTPEELLTGEKVDLSHIKMFGSQVRRI